MEFVMRRHAVILAAALASLTGIQAAEARLDILVDKATQRMLVMQDGYMRYIWPVSTGRDETATPNGVYAPQRLERSWFSNAYYKSPMPYSIFFHNGYAIHGSYAINQLGGPASHGCVRLHPHHAALLFDLVQQEGPDKTTIEVTDEARPVEPSLPGPGRQIAAGPVLVPPREIAAGPSLVPPREIAAGPSLVPPRQIAAGPSLVPPRQIAAGPSLVRLRQIAAGPDLYPPAPRIVRYRETGDMPELRSAPRVNRSIAARTPLPPKPAPAPAPAPESAPAPASAPAPTVHRPVPTDVVAEASSPERAQQAPSASAFKVLPASCWSGGASRWRWWNSGQTAPCK